MEADFGGKRVESTGSVSTINDAVSTDLFGFNAIRPKMLET
jgi:hypothetical protein